ncbi:MAG: ATP-binding protein [Verrucomicrobia bacterium]|nr:ATP-binding protein [Verrucomicrobiota bacterium]
MRPGSLSTKFDVSLFETGRLSEMIRRFGAWHGMPEDTIFVVNLSLDELVTNIVVHGGQGDLQVHEIMLRIRTEKDKVSIEIEDDGRAFNPLDAPEPDLSASLMDREPGGLGIHLARTLMDQIFYQRVGQRNLLTLTKRVQRASATAAS